LIIVVIHSLIFLVLELILLTLFDITVSANGITPLDIITGNPSRANVIPGGEYNADGGRPGVSGGDMTEAKDEPSIVTPVTSSPPSVGKVESNTTNRWDRGESEAAAGMVMSPPLTPGRPPSALYSFAHGRR
jgi:hypothetical protein